MAQAAGRGKLTDIHPSPDYIAGFIQFANGVRGVYRVRRGRAGRARGRRVVAQVPHRRAGHRRFRGSTDRRRLARRDKQWRCSGRGVMNYDLDMPPYIQEMADWLDDERRSPVQFRERLAGLRNHDGDVPLGCGARTSCAAAYRGRR